MRKPIYIRPLTEDEQQTLQEGLRSSNAFVLRRCQILLASARGQTARVIGETLGCDDQTVRNVLHAFNTQGLAALTPALLRTAADAPCRLRCPAPRAITGAAAPEPAHLWPPHQSVDLGLGGRRWRIPRASRTGPSVAKPFAGRLARLGVRWQRAKHWITSPDPAYLRKKNGATG